MTAVGYALSCTEQRPIDVVRHAARAEQAGFAFALVTDHDHPRADHREPSPFLWGVLGAIAQATERLRVGAGLACPTVGVDPVVVARAAATAAALMPGRFFLDLAAGETADETVELISDGWQDDEARESIRSVPDVPAPIYLAAEDQAAARQASRIGEGMVSLSPNASLVEAYRAAGGVGPRFGHVRISWAATEAAARHAAESTCPVSTIAWDDVPCGPDAERHLARIQQYLSAGYDRICLDQIGPDQAGFIRFAEGELLPALRQDTVPLAS